MLPVELSDEMLRQQWDIFLTIPKWRKVYGEDGQPIVEVLAKPAFQYCRPRFLVCCGNDANVKFVFLLSPQPSHLAIFENAQQLRLKRQWHFSDFVEKQ